MSDQPVIRPSNERLLELVGELDHYAETEGYERGYPGGLYSGQRQRARAELEAGIRALTSHETGALLINEADSLPKLVHARATIEMLISRHTQKASEQRTTAEEWENAKAVMSGEMPLPPCECTLRDKAPSAYHNANCPRYVAGKL